ncbi:MAG TPA: hypothetical protein ENN87_02085 [Phycisphaerales bacterium]|nr:hypothetical protein [Phycisphaerales bacterium]
MITHGDEAGCRQARPYFYDYLYHAAEVPGSIRDHIAGCPTCRADIERLERELATGGNEGDHAASGLLAATLQAHLVHIGRDVSCHTVKPYLPLQADPVLAVRVQTPITAHIERCRACSSDVETLGALGLSQKQLYRLSRMFAEEADAASHLCAEAEEAIDHIVAEMSFADVPREMLRHLCICPKCRRLLYVRREARINEIKASRSDATTATFPCEDVRYEDLFDYCLPYGVDSQTDQYARFRPALSGHVRECPVCLQRMQDLHDTIVNIADRPESDVAIVAVPMDVGTDAEAPSARPAGGRRPLHVAVLNREEAPAPRRDFERAAPPGRRPSPRLRVGPLLRTLGATAALLLVGYFIMTGIPTARAVGLDELYSAIQGVRNVHFAVFDASQAEPTQEVMISKDLHLWAHKVGARVDIVDLANQARETIDLEHSSRERSTLREAEAAFLAQSLRLAEYLMPWESPAQVPDSALWNEVHGANVPSGLDGVQTFEILWKDASSGGATIDRKWRGYVDPESRLPQRVEMWEKPAQLDEYVRTSVVTVHYLDATQVRERAAVWGFNPAGPSGVPITGND